jgi:hypothetical protein
MFVMDFSDVVSARELQAGVGAANAKNRSMNQTLQGARLETFRDRRRASHLWNAHCGVGKERAGGKVELGSNLD